MAPFDPSAVLQVCDNCGRESIVYTGGPEAICPACPMGGLDGDSHFAVSEADQAAWLAAHSGETVPELGTEVASEEAAAELVYENQHGADWPQGAALPVPPTPNPPPQLAPEPDEVGA